MSIDAAGGLLIASLAANSILAGTALDQAFKQLPARHRMGALAFADYHAAADLANGVPWYIGAALVAAGTSIAGVTVGLIDHRGGALTAALWLMVAATAGWMGWTAGAAPTAFSERRAAGDAVQLEKILNRFTMFNAGRAVTQVALVGINVWALAEVLNHT